VDEGIGVTLDRGTVVLVELDPTLGHEQRGVRPCITVSDPTVNADQRFPLIAVVPVTGTAGDGALYPGLAPGSSGLTKASYALVDHLRSIDKRRIRRIFGQVSPGELSSIDQGLELFLGLRVGRERST
jgi:mRNA interferase MazF